MTETTLNDKFTTEGILLKVQGLIAKADDPACTPQEAALYRDKAEAMMIKYRIDAQEAANRGEVKMAPIWGRVYLGSQTAAGGWWHYNAGIARMAASHTGVRFVTDRGDLWDEMYAVVVGFEHDVAFFEMLYTNMVQAFNARLAPKYSPDDSDAANALRLRQGGWERRRIAQALFPAAKTVNEQKGQNRQVTKLIKEEAERLGTPQVALDVLGRGFNAKTYRESYAKGFYNELWSRLWTMRSANSDAGLVLRSAKERVDEMFYERYPQQRPSTSSAAAAAPCERCKAAKSGHCRQHPVYRYKEERVNQKAYRQGQGAAREVELGAIVGRRVGQ